MKLISLRAALAAAVLVPTLAHAGLDSDRPVHPLMGVAVTGGGDSLVKVYFDDGDSRTVRAGGLVQIYGGAEYHPAGAPFALQGTIGYHVDDISADNGTVRFERFPVELIGLWNATDKFRLGVGARYAIGAKLIGSGDADIDTVNFKSDLGAIVMGEWLITPSMGVQLRYVHETFKYQGTSYDGSHVGLGYNYYF